MWTALGILILPLHQEITLSRKRDHPKLCLKLWVFVSNHDSHRLLLLSHFLALFPNQAPQARWRQHFFIRMRGGIQGTGQNGSWQQIVRILGQFLEIGDRTDRLKSTRGPSQVDPEQQQAAATPSMSGLWLITGLHPSPSPIFGFFWLLHTCSTKGAYQMQRVSAAVISQAFCTAPEMRQSVQHKAETLLWSSLPSLRHSHKNILANFCVNSK